jgi:SAM-dependent methyltransferase
VEGRRETQRPHYVGTNAKAEAVTKAIVEKYFEAVGENAWNDLVRRSSSATVFQSWRWQRAWWRAFHDAAAEPRELMLVCVRGDDSQLLAVAPLMLERDAGRRMIRFTGEGRADCLDIICDDEATGAREAVLEQFRQIDGQWDALELNRIPERSPTVELVKEWSGTSGFSNRWRQRVSIPTLPVRKQHGKESAAFTVAHTADPREILAQLDAFFVQHIHRWSSHAVQSQFVIRANRAFYRQLVEENGNLRFTTIRSGTKPVAYALALIGRDSLWCETSSDVVEAGSDVEAMLVDVLIALAGDTGADELALARGAELLADNAIADVQHCVSVRVTKEPSQWRSRWKRSAAGARVIALASELRQVAHVAMNASQIVEGRKKRAELGASHRDYYDAGSITRQYVRETRLQKPEQVILRELQPRLPQMRVLDVGVGAGRTVPYFGTTALDYRGFDFAPNMVATTQQLTGDLVDPARITVGDARDMRDVPDASCDLVLISYNAIDDIGGEADRFKVLAEVKRVAAPGGYFCFSSHNMKSLTRGGAGGLLPRLVRWRRYRLLSAANRGLDELRKEPHAMIHDVGLDYRFPHYYIAPSAQARQLADFGFTNVRVFSVNTGLEILDASRWDDLIDSWVYYLCRA